MNTKRTVTFLVIVLMVVLGIWCFNHFSYRSAGAGATIATGGTKGTYFTVGRAIAKAVRKDKKLNLAAETGNASVANINAVANKEVTFGIIQADIAYWAYNGERMFRDAPIKNVRSVCALYPEHIQVILSRRTKINNLTDFKGKRIGAGARESGTMGDAEALLQQAGLSMDDIRTAYLDFAATTRLLTKKELDAGFVVAGVPTKPVEKFFESDVKENNVSHFTLLDFDEDFLTGLQEKYPFMIPSVIPAETYKGLSDVKTPAIMSFVITNEDTDDNTIYNFLEALYKNINIVKRSHEMGEHVTLETATQGLTIPLHPAAEKFFKDKGIIK